MDFIKTVIAADTSYEALLFLEYFAKTSPLLVDSKGVRQPLIYAYNGTEKLIENWRIDGYAFVDGRHIFIEFLGCHWHGCVVCGSLANDEDNDAVYMKRVKSENEKYAHLRRLGTLILQRECLWVQKRKQIQNFNTEMPRIWNRQENHAQLLKSIQSGEVYGFGKVSVKSPRWITEAQRLSGFFYPPIATKIQLKKEYFDDEPKDLPKNPVLTQVFNTVQPVLLLSKVIQYYMELGCEIQIYEFIQFKGEKCFAPFVDKVVGLRMEGKNEGNQQKSNTAKLCGNASFGKTIGNFFII